MLYKHQPNSVKFASVAGVPVFMRPSLNQHTPLPVFFTGSINI
jgi:hypothetical protein